MPRKPTGRPAGRPKSLTGYETLMCRLPKDKAAQIKAAATRQGIQISALMRQALDTWLQAHQPPFKPLQAKEVPNRPQMLSATVPMWELPPKGGSYTVSEPRTTQDIRQTTTIPEPDKSLTEIVPTNDSCETETVTTEDSCQTETIPSLDKSQTETATADTPAGLVFDATKHVLGKLCPRLHDHDGTGKSVLRRSNRHCILCDREKFHERPRAKRKAKRQAAGA